MVVFKDSSWKWQRNFDVSNFMDLQITMMKFNGEWIIDLKKYLPKFLSFLAPPLMLLYFTFWSFVVVSICFLYVIKLVIIMNSEDPTIPEITTAFTQSVIYFYASYATIHFQWYQKDLADILNFMTKNFKMRSARGLPIIYLWCI